MSTMPFISYIADELELTIITIPTTEDGVVVVGVVVDGVHPINIPLIMATLVDGHLVTFLEEVGHTVLPVILMVFLRLAVPPPLRRRRHQAADLVQRQVRPGSNSFYMCRIQFALDSSELHAKFHIPIKA